MFRRPASICFSGANDCAFALDFAAAERLVASSAAARVMAEIGVTQK
jgi:hypothetical protein